MMKPVTVTYYLDVLSSWCLIAEPAVERMRAEFGPRVDYEWRIAALRHPLDYTPEQLAWYYRRTESVTGVRLNPAWLESTADGTKWANLAAEAARASGCTDDRVRIALARGAMIDGKHMGQRDAVIEAAARAGGLDEAALGRAMADPNTVAAIRASSDEFAKFNVGVRPTFVVRNAIGDASVLSGCWRYELLAAAIDAAIQDAKGYETFMASNKAPAGTT